MASGTVPSATASPMNLRSSLSLHVTVEFEDPHSGRRSSRAFAAGDPRLAMSTDMPNCTATDGNTLTVSAVAGCWHAASGAPLQ